MRRWIAVILLTGIVLALAGAACGGGTKTAPTATLAPTSTAVAPTATETPPIGPDARAMSDTAHGLFSALYTSPCDNPSPCPPGVEAHNRSAAATIQCDAVRMGSPGLNATICYMPVSPLWANGCGLPTWVFFWWGKTFLGTDSAAPHGAHAHGAPADTDTSSSVSIVYDFYPRQGNRCFDAPAERTIAFVWDGKALHPDSPFPPTGLFLDDDCGRLVC